MTLLCKPILERHHALVPQAYQSLEAELHDAFQDSHGPSPEIPLMKAFLKRHPGRSLEVGCGSGRLLGPLRQAGFEVEGLELSSDMIARAKAELAAHIHQGDMSDWAPERPYCSLLAPAFTLQLAEDVPATLKHWRSWLKPGGGLYLTTFVPYAELTGEYPEGEWYLDHETTLANGERAILETRHQVHADEQKVTRHHRYRVEGRAQKVHECTQVIRWGEPWQWQQWLETAGFKLDTQFLDWDPKYNDCRPVAEEHEGIITTLGLAMDA